MSDTAHLESLILRHRQIDLKIQEGYSDYLDDAHLKKMKQEKLYLKDQIEFLKKKGLSEEENSNSIGFN